jgi:hypothetical protein
VLECSLSNRSPSKEIGDKDELVSDKTDIGRQTRSDIPPSASGRASRRRHLPYLESQKVSMLHLAPWAFVDR